MYKPTVVWHAVPPSRVEVVASPAELTVREGEEATFECHVKRSDARTRLVWSRLSRVIHILRTIFLCIFARYYHICTHGISAGVRKYIYLIV